MPELEPWGRECPMGTGIVTLDENDNRLNRKNPHAPSFDRKENQEVWEEAIKPDLDAADITGAIPEELILTDRRHTEKQKENRKVKEIKIMDRIDEELDQIRDQNLDTHHRIDENLRTWCKRLILLASKKKNRIRTRSLQNQGHQNGHPRNLVDRPSSLGSCKKKRSPVRARTHF